MKLIKVKALVSISLIAASLYSCGIYQEDDSTADTNQISTVTTSVTTQSDPVKEVNKNSTENTEKYSQASVAVTSAAVTDNADIKKPSSANPASLTHNKNENLTYYTSMAFCSGYYGGTPIDDEIGINSFTDKNMQNTVTEWISSSVEGMTDEVNTIVSCVNGYLLMDIYFTNDSGDVTDVKSAVFDLYSNKKLELNDLFYNTEEYRSYCNSLIDNACKRGEIYSNCGSRVPVIKTGDFTGLDDTFSAITCQGIYIYPQNPFIKSGLIYNIYYEDEFLLNNSVIFSEPRDMNGIFTDDVFIREDSVREFTDDFSYEYRGKTENFDVVSVISSCNKWSSEKIQNVNTLADKVMSDEKVKSDLYKRFSVSADGPAMYNDYGLFSGYSIAITGLADENLAAVTVTYKGRKNDGGHDGKLVYFYDADTLELLSNEEIIKRLFGENPTQNCVCSYRSDTVSYDKLSEAIKDMVPSNFYSDNINNNIYREVSFDTLQTSMEDIIEYGGKYSVTRNDNIN